MQKQQIKIILNLFVVLNFQEILHQTYFQPINVISDHSVEKKGHAEWIAHTDSQIFQFPHKHNCNIETFI